MIPWTAIRIALQARARRQAQPIAIFSAEWTSPNGDRWWIYSEKVKS